MADEVFQEVEQLLKDREKYESWLKRLESQRPEASESAYDRVREDYQGRLDAVLNALGAHSESIRAKHGELEGKVSEVERERASRVEALDEARLRRSVGEYGDDSEWGELEAGLVAAVEEQEGELGGIRAEITHLEEVLRSVEGPEAPAAAAETSLEAKAEAAYEAAADLVTRPAAEVSETKAAAAGAAAEEGFVSLEELVLEDKSVDEAIVPAPAEREPEPEPEPEATSAEPPDAAAEVGDELAFLESLSLGNAEESDAMTFLEEKGAGEPQTIVCPACSAANDPAEWYCTECGEELPAE